MTEFGFAGVALFAIPLLHLSLAEDSTEQGSFH